MSSHIVAAMSGIRIEPAVSDADILRSLEVYNVVHTPHRESLAGVREAERRARDFGAFNAYVGSEIAGAHVYIPSHSDLPSADVYVLPKRRDRGIGDALFREVSQIAWAKREGFQRLLTVNAVDNAPIRRLNDELGYRSIPGRIRLRGPVA
jgi:GNAT superfamily N-acetyltransferase